MKKRWVSVIATVIMLSMTGCGQKEGQESSSGHSSPEQVRDSAFETGQIESSPAAGAEISTGQQDPANPPAANSEEKKWYEDNFAVDNEAAAEYGNLIKEAVAEKNLEKLADLTGFPVYVGFSDGGLVVETREDFIALGGERIFTDEMVSSIDGADVTGLMPSMAGFTMYDGDGAPNIIFGVRDGSLAISGINY